MNCSVPLSDWTGDKRTELKMVSAWKRGNGVMETGKRGQAT